MHSNIVMLVIAVFITLSIAVGSSIAHGDMQNTPHGPTLAWASYYDSYMVLQQAPQRAIVWGYSDAIGTVINVTTISTTTRFTVQAKVFLHKGLNKGVWIAKLLAVSEHGPFTITATDGVTEIDLLDVLFGDVWICSGQSNMQFTLSMVFNASEEIADSINYPNIRLFTVSLNASSELQYDLLQVEQKWAVAAPATVGQKAWSYFSAVCWLYGKYLNQALNRPIGLITSAWGGTAIELWMSPDALAVCDLNQPYSGYHHANENLPLSPSNLWNSMIHPFLNMTIYGAIWYQGEANTGSPDTYNCTFPAMITDWRQKFNLGSGETEIQFPFGFVQLAANENTTALAGWPDIRWHQTADIGYVPNHLMPRVFMAVAMDLPDFESPYTPIHPRDKQGVAHRLTLAGLAIAYNVSDVRYQGPFPSAFIVATSTYQLTIVYDDGKWPIVVHNATGFEVCCVSDSATAICNSSNPGWMSTPIMRSDSYSVTVLFIGCKVQNIVGVRYAWRESPCSFKQCPVYSNVNSLPAPSFVFDGQIAVRQTKQLKYQPFVKQINGIHVYTI